MLGLYLHIPFCASICSYCNFNRGLLDAAVKARYVDALAREIREAGDGAPADTIFFGGGTPSLLDPAEVARLIGVCRTSYALTPDAEITLETNPETVTAERLDAFLGAGVTRLSLGVQSFDADELGRLGRAHTAQKAMDAIGLATRAGFDSVSFDLMLWLPGQSLASWERTLERSIALAPDHLSLYLLELYPNAPLKEAMARAGAGAAFAQVAEDTAADMYLMALDRLDQAGYGQYEISNVARPGHKSRHNVKDRQGGSWRGFGCGAHSTVAGVRWHNVASTAEYIQRIDIGQPPVAQTERLSNRELLEEALFTGLRLAEGIDGRNIEARFGVDPWSRYGEALAPCITDGLMWKEASRFGLTRRGMLVANEILMAFV